MAGSDFKSAEEKDFGAQANTSQSRDMEENEAIHLQKKSLLFKQAHEKMKETLLKFKKGKFTIKMEYWYIPKIQW